MDIGAMMKQAQVMQKKLLDAQEKLKLEEATGVAGGGMVKVTINGAFDMTKVNIDKSLCVAEDVEMLEDLIVVAYNSAKAEIDKKMSEITNGFNLGGMKLPF